VHYDPKGASEGELLQILVDKISAMVAYWDSTQRCRFANRAYEKWFGVSPASLIGKHMSELLGPLYQLNLPYIEEALRGEHQEFEREIPDPTGGPSRHSLAEYIPDIVDQVVRGFFVLVTDISAIKRAERALRESEERFRRTFDEAPIGMALVALDGHFVRVNSAFCEMVGYAADVLTGLTFQAITHPDDLDADLSLARSLAQGEIPRYQLEKRYIRKDGATIDVMLSGSVLRGPDGRPTYFIAQVEDITQRKRLAEELRLAAATSSGILSISADAIISIDETTSRITMFNEGAERIFGYSRAQAIGAALDMLIPERLRARHRRHVDAFVAGTQAARQMGDRGAVIVGLRKNGDEFPAEAAISKLEVGGKKVLTVALRDITEQKLAEDAIRQAEERVQLAVDGADLASWDWNIATGEVIFNQRWAEMRGFRPEEIRPHVDSWISDIHPEDRPRVDKALTDCFEGRCPAYEADYRVRTKSGQWIWIQDWGKVFARDEAGKPVRMVGIELDITERKRSQDEQAFLAEAGTILASSLEFEDTVSRIARLALRHLADCVIVDVVERGDEVRRILVMHADPTKRRLSEQLKRFRIDRARPYLASAMIETKQPALMSEIGAQYIESVAQSEEHLRLLRELDPRSMMVVPLSAHDRMLGAVVFISSNPARCYEARDLDFAKELAHRFALAIDNAQLYEIARRATQSRDEVLGIVAHDLRNPLSSIVMHTALLAHHGEQPERRSRIPLEAIERATERMNRIIQDLLEVTRIEAGHLGCEMASVSPAQAMADAVETQQALAYSAFLKLELDAPRELPEIWADSNRLLQVFENLIGNAIKFTGPGGRVTVGAAPRAGDVLFWVTDTGKGIAAGHLPHLFDRFWQARNAKQGGAGLGLTIVKGIIEAHGGRVWVESTPGKGSSFSFTIPTVPHEPETTAGSSTTSTT
jgi:PAS domain S-box-containing protein